MAEIAANDGFCGQICGQTPETNTRNFLLKTDIKEGGKTISKIFMVRFVVSRAGRGLVFGGKGGFRRLIKSAKFSKQITTNNNSLFFIFLMIDQKCFGSS